MQFGRLLKQILLYGIQDSGTWPVERRGSDYGGWWFTPVELGQESIIYSFGVGTDVSFDLALMEQFGVSIHAFDPTPRSINWVHRQSLPQTFEFHEYGIAAYDGIAEFAPPENPMHVSYSMIRTAPGPDSVVKAPVMRLATIMERLGHRRVDLLKLDIEGAEYEVILDLANCRWPIKQLLVEFHHDTVPGGWRRTRQAVEQLKRLGFRLAKVAHSGNEATFFGPELV